jgi:RNA polymerase sigma-70 factor (ECF subfamily)
VSGEKTDAALITSSLARPERFEAVFDRHFASIHRYLERRLGRDLADELAAETFTQAFASRERYDGSHESARPWLFGIAANLIRRHHRTEGRRSAAYARAGADVESDAAPNLDGRIDAAAQRSDLASALAALPEGERDALLLFAWADLSYEEIGRALDVPTGTVKSRIWRARSRLRELLRDCGQVEGEEAMETHHE